MTCLAQKGVSYPRPRCDAVTVKGSRCNLHASYQEDGKTLCQHHRPGGRLAKMFAKSKPQSVTRYVASYEDGRDIIRKEIDAASKQDAEQRAASLCPHGFRLFNLIQKASK